MKTLADRIKSLRLKGETQAQFAERLGTTQASISRYLNGRHPDRETLIKIARCTGVSLDWLLTGEGKRAAEKETPKSDPELMEAALASIEQIKSIPPREKDDLKSMLKDFFEDREIRKRLLSGWEESKKS